MLQVEAEAGALEDEDSAPAPVIAHAGPDIDLEAEDPEDLGNIRRIIAYPASCSWLPPDAEFDLEEFADYTPEVNPTVVSSHEGDGDTHGLDDADSMVSSVTLSSTKSSSKRSLDDVFAEDGVESSEEVVVGSPGSSTSCLTCVQRSYRKSVQVQNAPVWCDMQVYFLLPPEHRARKQTLFP